ncbi:DUF1178 family protein [Sphingomonas colocasiae]|uniref:DUF1178 family protein n=1 Tax=Sphingomonas colocasiae TaxID=1848973 RepID=A0ABS7PIW7_9SPHN|nr:DUF1178 family protein [Sphingomonas colocasiae]MBY8821242.1 DUF1178 family protein [Sphingomonas colocasiae]
MIVFDLRCGHDHVFEAWFGSSDDYADQKRRGLLSCPMCGDVAIEKAVMAPNVSAKGNSRSEPSNVPMAAGAQAPAEHSPAEVKAMLAMLARAQSAMLEKSEWVGRDFADRARAMHLGESDQSAIHGEVSPEQAKALVDEGVPVAPLPFPVVPPEAQN